MAHVLPERTIDQCGAPKSAAPWWVAATYLIYAIVLDGGILGASFYLVYLGHSGWWVLGGLLIASCTLSPKKWRQLWTPKNGPQVAGDKSREAA